MSQVVAQEILRQIKALSRMALPMWGANSFVSTEDGLQFDTKMKIKNRNMKVIIKLNSNDLYDLEIGYVCMRKVAFVSISQETDIFCEDLVRELDSLLENRKAA